MSLVDNRFTRAAVATAAMFGTTANAQDIQLPPFEQAPMIERLDKPVAPPPPSEDGELRRDQVRTFSGPVPRDDGDPFAAANAKANDELLEQARQGVEDQLRGIEQKLGIPTINLKTVLGPETPAKNNALLERLQLVTNFIADQKGLEAPKLLAQPKRLMIYGEFTSKAGPLVGAPRVGFEGSASGEPGVTRQSRGRATLKEVQKAFQRINLGLAASPADEQIVLPKSKAKQPAPTKEAPVEGSGPALTIPPAPDAAKGSVNRKKIRFGPVTNPPQSVQFVAPGRVQVREGDRTPKAQPSTKPSETSPKVRPEDPTKPQDGDVFAGQGTTKS